MISPNKAWFKAIDKIYANKYSIQIANELSLRSDLKTLLNEKISSFISWAGKERLQYIPNLDEEVKDFLNKEFIERKRAYSTNVKAWKLLTKIIFQRDNFTCQYCGKIGGKLECDHIVPFSQGGSDEIENLITACQKCNRSKRDKNADTFKEWLKKQNHHEK